MPSSTDPKTKPAQKHRACDACRSRKLACSKEDNDISCSRCKREEITCIFSEQKPMGRPRKRRCVEVETRQNCAGDNEVIQAGVGTIESLPDLSDFDFDLLNEDIAAFGASGLESDFLANSEFFFDNPNIPSFDAPLPELDFLDAAKQHRVEHDERGIRNGKATLGEDGKVIWHFGHAALPQDINLDGVCSTASSSASNFSEESRSNPSITPPSSTNTETPPSSISLQTLNSLSPETPHMAPCDCLSSLYIALASLQVLNSNITIATSTIRQAAYIAKSVLRCKICGTCPITCHRPPMRSLQNNMLLGTLLPVIADGYKRLLNVIDEQCTSALLANSKIYFQPAAYGGVKTILAMECNWADTCDWEKEVEPLQWRNALRNMLRADVYGVNGNEEYGGLQGLIKEMESRQRKRHDELDRANKESLLPLVQDRLCLGEVGLENRTCEKILDLARIALGELVIA